MTPECGISKLTEDEYNAWRYNYPRIEAKRDKAAIDKLRAERRKPDTTE